MSTTAREIQPQPMSPEAFAEHLLARLEQRVLGHVIAYGQLTVTVAPEALPGAVQLCRDDPRLACDFFDFMSGVDEREDGFAVVTHLYSTTHRHHVQIRALAVGGRDEPHLPTISHLYAGANWHEREVYDMFGIVFDGHPGLLPRILTVENFEGYPLRKEFLLMTREVKPWPGLKEPKDPDDEDDGGDAAPAGGPSAEDKARMAREKAERAKAKAAEARKRRAQEQAATGPAAPAAADVARPEGAGEVGAEKRAQLEYGAGRDERAGDPVGAADASGDAVAKDAAAGAVAGDTAAGAPGDEPGDEQPAPDLDREAEIAGGARASASGTPGVEAEGRHAGAEEQAGDRPASQTPGMVSDTQEAEAAQPAGNVPAPHDAGGTQVAKAADAPHGPGEETPRALRDEGGVRSVPLAEEQGQGPVVGETYTEAPEERRPIGTDADDRLREREGQAPDDADEEDSS
ncbi:MAG TPA: NADH-quinone oxidoreductase subunit C [Euzebyales bacterium]|nr:NADH-quinone oxidoreductase subunit C [Euzebyales bacterium]